MAKSIANLKRESAVLLVIDLQEKLLPLIHEAESTVAAVGKLIQAAMMLGVPLLATEQYPAGLGRTSHAITALWGNLRPVEKTKFSGCVEEIVAALAKLKRPHVIVVGIEAHVCVLQSVMDLLRLGYLPFLCADALSSRRSQDCRIAIERMRDAGGIITTVESVIFEMVGEAGTDEFKQILKVVK
jgi:nicotinamidase-related amidase